MTNQRKLHSSQLLQLSINHLHLFLVLLLQNHSSSLLTKLPQKVRNSDWNHPKFSSLSLLDLLQTLKSPRLLWHGNPYLQQPGRKTNQKHQQIHPASQLLWHLSGKILPQEFQAFFALWKFILFQLQIELFSQQKGLIWIQFVVFWVTAYTNKTLKFF